MKINYDKIADAVYFSLTKGKVASTVEMDDRLIVDLDKTGNIIGIELLDASTQMGTGANSLEKIVRTGIPVHISSGTPITA